MDYADFDAQTFSDDDNCGDWLGHDNGKGERNSVTVDQSTKPFSARENSSNVEHHADDLDDLYASIDTSPLLAVDQDIRFTLRRHSRFVRHARRSQRMGVKG